MKKPTLLVTLGFPGSGKSYFSEKISKEKGFFHINSDIIRFTLFKNPSFTKEEHEGVFALMDLITENLLKSGISVIYDCNTNFRSDRKRLEKIAKKSQANHFLVWIKTDVKLAEKRLAKRFKIKDGKKKLMYRPVTLETLHKLKNEMQTPKGAEKFIPIDGHLPFSKQIKELEKVLK
jgi:predicted kinase